jgi:predicted peroxiredoxin
MVMHWLFLLAATAFWLAAAVGATPLRARGRLPVAVAHRGASGDAPENTMAAFRLAVDLGSAGFETDLHMTADGVVVLLHDSDIRRTTCGWPDDLPSYNIANLEWSFVSTLDAGSWFGPEFEGERVPLLQEGLDLARETGVLAYLDVKSSATGRAGLIYRIGALGRSAVYPISGRARLALTQYQPRTAVAAVGRRRAGSRPAGLRVDCE